LNDLKPDLLLVVVESVQEKIVVGCGETVDLNGAIAALVFWNPALLHDALRCLH